MQPYGHNLNTNNVSNQFGQKAGLRSELSAEIAQQPAGSALTSSVG